MRLAEIILIIIAVNRNTPRLSRRICVGCQKAVIYREDDRFDTDEESDSVDGNDNGVSTSSFHDTDFKLGQTLFQTIL